LAFLGDVGKFFGLGSSKEVLSDIGGAIGGTIGGTKGAFIGSKLGGAVGQATSGLDRGSNVSPASTADQALEQSAFAVSDPGSRPQETSSNVGTTGAMGNPTQAFINPFAITQGLRGLGGGIQKFFGKPIVQGGIGGIIGAEVADPLFPSLRKQKPVLTQSRRNKARVRQLANFIGIEGAAEFLSAKSGVSVTSGDVIDLLLRTFRNDGAYITKAQVRNLRRTTNRFKSLEKQVKEATRMTRSTTTRRTGMKRASNVSLIKN
jgi:hypothetical protein